MFWISSVRIEEANCKWSIWPSLISSPHSIIPPNIHWLPDLHFWYTGVNSVYRHMNYPKMILISFTSWCRLIKITSRLGYKWDTNTIRLLPVKTSWYLHFTNIWTWSWAPIILNIGFVCYKFDTKWYTNWYVYDIDYNVNHWLHKTFTFRFN